MRQFSYTEKGGGNYQLLLADTRFLTGPIEELGLLSFSRARAAWLVETRAYPKLEPGHISSIADLLLGVAYIERNCGMAGTLQEDGHVSFVAMGKPGIRVLLIDGSAGNYRWLTLESDLRQRNEQFSKARNQTMSKRVLACGVVGRKPSMATPPTSIIDGADDEPSIVNGSSPFAFWDVDEIRTNADILHELLT